MSTSQQEDLEAEPLPSTLPDHPVAQVMKLRAAPPGASVRQLIDRLVDLEDRMRDAPVFLPTGSGRTKAINPDYLDLLLQQARVVAALRAVRRRRVRWHAHPATGPERVHRPLV